MKCSVLGAYMKRQYPHSHSASSTSLVSEPEGVKQPNPYPAAGRRMFVIAMQEVSGISEENLF